ncbi:hypothetical protein BDU57DRAFT_597438 [Ampelomyces quisqualis]|uniref:Dynamin N-terminal domain-containing protein n=1 Tax=Ampelomyces quisqualis TaxID=50730 RepID=A0A6A5QC45_AMPQU|nr:hypothetical protein BDU57DRAFT_597438 [Ampelomyces quisqualis]
MAAHSTASNMSEVVDTGPTGTHLDPTDGTSRKRPLHISENLDASEQFPDHPWFKLNHLDLQDFNNKLCSVFKARLERYASLDESIKDLVDAAEAAKRLPNVTVTRVAVPGQQGVGKTTLINALFDRYLLAISGGSRACTAFVTIIKYKDGAADDTKTSDIIVHFYNEAEMITCIQGQANNWWENRRTLKNEDDAQEPFHAARCEDDDGDTSTDNKATTQAKESAAETAKDFFEIVFCARKYPEQKEFLHSMLYNADTSKEDFISVCLHHAKDNLAHLQSELNIQDGKSTHEDIPDSSMRTIRNMILDLWPFVKLAEIATGHMLLRYGMQVYDMPGYGDISQLREASLNKYRKQSDFEMVVAPHARFKTDIMHDRYLGRSLRRKKTEGTILVMTRSDELLKSTNFVEQISRIHEEPFISLTKRVDELGQMDVERKRKTAIRKEIYREALAAYVQYETKLIQEDLEKRNIKSFSVSAEKHMELIEADDMDTLPLMSMDACGIAALRRFLYELPASSNYRSYTDHVFKKLPRLEVLAGLVFEVHVEDKSYAAMRQDLRQKVPILKFNLESLISRQMATFISAPWVSKNLGSVYEDMRHLGEAWQQNYRWRGFEKMLREGGKPTNGRYEEHNLNDEICIKYRMHMDEWYRKMKPKTRQIALSLDSTVQDAVVGIAARIIQSSADIRLKVRAVEALVYTTGQVQAAHDTLVLELDTSLRENYLHFTSEEDIQCPVAMEMAPVYTCAQGVTQGRGVYRRSCAKVLSSILPEKDYPHRQPAIPLLENIKTQVVERQKALWKMHCTTFTTSVFASLDLFSRTSEQLLQNAAYATQEHKKARAELREVLSEFRIRLKHLQSYFDVTEEESLGKKIKRNSQV